VSKCTFALVLGHGIFAGDAVDQQRFQLQVDDEFETSVQTRYTHDKRTTTDRTPRTLRHHLLPDPCH